MGEQPTLTGTRCASVHGFSLHANTQVPAHRRDQLERLMRYTTRGVVSRERLQEDTTGDLVYTFTRPWSDGTMGIQLAPLELLEKLAALVPLPRVHLVRYGGCVAPHSRLRGSITPTPRQQGVEGPEVSSASPRSSWARLLKRVFAIDLATCLPPLCGRREARRRAAPTQSHQALRPSVLSSGVAAIHRGHPAGRGHQKSPPASEACGRPTPECSGPFSPRRLRLGRLPCLRPWDFPRVPEVRVGWTSYVLPQRIGASCIWNCSPSAGAPARSPPSPLPSYVCSPPHGPHGLFQPVGSRQPVGGCAVR
jgi:hypothetical protein